MNPNEYKDIFIDTDSQEYKHIKEIFDSAQDLITQMIADYCQLLTDMSSDGVTTKADGYTNTIIALITRKLIEHLDAVNILFHESCMPQVFILLRSYYETIVSLKYILQGDIINRAAAYQIDKFYERIRLSRKLYGEGKETKLLIRDTEANIQMFDSLKYVDGKRKKKLEDINLARKKEGKKKISYINWYNICSNIKDFARLCEAVNMNDSYKNLYSLLSQEVHARTALRDLSAGENNQPYLDLIRLPANAGANFTIITSLFFDSLKEIFEYLMHTEEEHKVLAGKLIIYVSKRDKVVNCFSQIKLI